MRLFSLPDGTIDRKDRGQWITVPFDLQSDPMRGSTGRGSFSRRPWRIRQYQALATPIMPPLAEETSVDRYEHLWRMPVVKRRQPIHTDPAAILDPSLIPEDEIGNQVRPWHVEFSQPVRPKFRPYLYQFNELLLHPDQVAEEILVEKWHSPFSQQFRTLGERWRVHLIPFHAMQLASWDEEIMPSVFVGPLSIPTREPIWARMRVVIEPVMRMGMPEDMLGEDIQASSWFVAFNRPVPGRRYPVFYIPSSHEDPNVLLVGNVFESPMLSGGLMWW